MQSKPLPVLPVAAVVANPFAATKTLSTLISSILPLNVGVQLQRHYIPFYYCCSAKIIPP